MDSKKVLEKLLKIAENQQKIIMKLAQGQGLPPDALPSSKVEMGGGHDATLSHETIPTPLKPAPTQKEPDKVFYSSMTPAQQGLLAGPPTVAGKDMQVKFKPGRATQANYDGLLKLLQNLTTQNKIQSAYALKVV